AGRSLAEACRCSADGTGTARRRRSSGGPSRQLGRESCQLRGASASVAPAAGGEGTGTRPIVGPGVFARTRPRREGQEAAGGFAGEARAGIRNDCEPLARELGEPATGKNAGLAGERAGPLECADRGLPTEGASRSAGSASKRNRARDRRAGGTIV